MYERDSWHAVTARGDEALTRYLIEQGLELNLSTFPIEFRRRLGEYFSQREKDLLETTYTYVLLELLRDKGYARMPDDLIRKALDHLFAITQTNWILEEDTMPTLKKLEQDGYRMGLISNAVDDQDVKQLIQGFEISTYFYFIMKTVALLSLCIVVAMATNNNLPEVELPPIVGEGGALPPGYGSPPSTCYISKQCMHF